MDKSFHEYVRPRLTDEEFDILVNHTQPGPKGYIGLRVSECRSKYKMSYHRFKRLLERLDDYAVTYERQVIIDID